MYDSCFPYLGFVFINPLVGEIYVDQCLILFTHLSAVLCIIASKFS